MSTLKIYGGLDVKKRARILPDAAAVVGEDDFKKLKRKLNNHSLPTKNKHHARFTFSRQLPRSRGDHCELHSMAKWEGKRLQIWQPDQQQDTRAPNTDD